ncbi:Homeodomain-like protein [Artemisia annua]|uniref:Homeodomain-like protein n=1 Tax=Artemisia annua TaxID=35608 RepID=A0A2U1PP59_ARTAN|nr:Homeodomain-like protein [Artemisia annua]PWA87492.1 Homeodomain-like protein [Artemisia annua]
MTRRCSHCSNNGHNSRTCPNRGLKLFGVRITDGSIRKSASMGNLSHYNGSSSSNNLLSGFNGNTDLDSPGDTPDCNNGGAGDGYGSEDFVAGSGSSRERKKGVPWTEEEHRMFLLGLQKLGKGDWRGIARNYVITRTPTQVASHAQKYFIRQSNISRRKRRSSLFDIVADDSADTHMNPSQPEAQSINNPLTIPTLEEELEECESMDSANSNTADLPVDQTPVPLDGSQLLYPVMFPAYVSPLIPVAIPYWPGPGSSQDQSSSGKTESHEVLKPTAVHSKSPINVDDLVGMSKLTLGESIGDGATTSLKLAGGLSRQSAFHASNPGPRSSNMDSGHNPIHAL